MILNCQYRKRRFTLIEMMIVLLILVMLTALVGPAVMGKLEKAKAQTAKTQIGLLKNAVRDYYMETNEYPKSLEELVRDSGVSGWNGPYLDPPVVPKDPWNNAYHYEYPGSHGTFDIYSYGKDGKPGGEKNNADITSWVEQ
jgi:general secretion pathway protein G